MAARREPAFSQDELRDLRLMLQAYRDHRAGRRYLGAAWGRGAKAAAGLAAIVVAVSSILSVYYSAKASTLHPQVIIEKVRP